MEATSIERPASQRHRSVACSECRQHKLKCDAHQDYSKPCSRCRHRSLECKILGDYKRIKKPTKAELVREIERIRKEVNPTAASDVRPLEHDSTLRGQMNDGSKSTAQYNIAAALSEAPYSPASSVSTRDQHNLQQDAILDLQGQSRTIDGVTIAPEKINDCFNIFATHYSPQVPVVEQPMLLDATFDKSPLLPWTIVTVGSRKYSQDPTVFHQLSHRMIKLAFQSLQSRQSPIQTVQALVILCTWPLPVKHLFQDKIHTLAGACMQLALQIGLHVSGVGQDFAREHVQAHLSEQNYRALLWRYCTIVCQSASIGDGLPPSMIVESFNPDWVDHNPIGPDLNQLALRTKLHHIQSSAISKIVPYIMGPADDGSLEGIIEIFDSQAHMLRSQLQDDIDILTMYCVRLHICVSRFMVRQPVSMTGLMELYGIAIGLIEKYSAMDAATDLALYSTFYHSRTLGLASFVILKLHHSPQHLVIDRERGERCYFSVIRLCRRRCLDTPDLDLKLATILTELWSSSMVFRGPDGTVDALNVRIRSRLTMSVFFDCLWWWRQEFRGQPDPFVSHPPTVSQTAVDSLTQPLDTFMMFPEGFDYDENYFGMYETYHATLPYS